MFAYFIQVKRGIGSLSGPSWVPHGVRVTIPRILREFHFYGYSKQKGPTPGDVYKFSELSRF